MDGWILNARIEYQLDHYVQALQAIDYALALEPDNAEAAWVKSMIMPMTVDSDNIPVIIDHIRRVIKARPDWLPATTALAVQYERAGNRSAMFATYDAFIARSQSTEDIVAASVEALKKNPPDRLPYLHAIDRTINREGGNLMRSTASNNGINLLLTSSMRGIRSRPNGSMTISKVSTVSDFSFTTILQSYTATVVTAALSSLPPRSRSSQIGKGGLSPTTSRGFLTV